MKTPQYIRKRWNLLAKLNGGVLCGCVGFDYPNEQDKYGIEACQDACAKEHWGYKEGRHQPCTKCDKDWWLPLGGIL